MKKNCKKQVKKNLGEKNYLKEKVINCMSNGSGMIVVLDWQKRSDIKMSQYFSKTFRRFEGNINVKVDLPNYTTKTDLKNVTCVDTSGFALKTNLASLKTEVDKLDIDKLVPFPVDLSKLSDLIKNDNVKKAVNDKLIVKVNNIDASDIVLKINIRQTKQN